ncbi:spore coat protein [Clostridium magnum]|uniref:Spore coat protein F n=1 Tax=Clostridium magnum DSM 2767 TaxID=1121326 RepID=A0A161XDV2_9CLOT|nr:spore coat protein [Clostridium magnum]KZL92526.1 spore coat protein F precursor [Clostridium magnum DSM 2767]SHI79888.1 Coat F domain-containing protein [Clostridium magnum DSM 2767]
MINDYLELRNAEGMPRLVDATMALSFLLSAKSAVRNCALALGEAVTPEVRTVLKNQLNNAINMHEEISNMMINKGWFHPNNLDKQFQMDIESSQTAVQIASLDLFPGDTSRLGTFATPEK